MSILWVFVLLSYFLMTTNSSAIGEPQDVEKSPLPEVLDPNRGGQDQPMSEESQVLVQLKNASSAELNSSYCSQFDNSCVKCVKQGNCTMVKYTKETKTDIDVEDIEFECFDITASLEEIRQSFADKTYNVIQTVSDCPTAYSKRPILKNGAKSNAGTTTQANLSSAKTATQSTLMDNTTITTDATNSTTGTSSTTSTTMGTTSMNTTRDTTTATTKSTQKTSTMIISSTSSPSTGGTNSSRNPPPPQPQPSTGGWSFWSFFGGILLTLGLSAIGFVGFKYYKARSGQQGGFGLNYNRF